MPLRALIVILILFFCHEQAWSLCVSKSRANLRSGPGTNFKVTWVVGKYMPLLQVSRKGNWIRVKDLDGEFHWVHRKLITNDYDCLVVKSSISNLRSRPTPRASKSELGFADRFTPFKKLDRNGNWLLAEDDYGQKAWIYDRNVWEPIRYSTIEF